MRRVRGLPENVKGSGSASILLSLYLQVVTARSATTFLCGTGILFRPDPQGYLGIYPKRLVRGRTNKNNNDSTSPPAATPGRAAGSPRGSPSTPRGTPSPHTDDSARFR